MTDTDKLSERVTRVEESSKQAHHRITKLENIEEQLQSLALSVNTIMTTMQALTKDFTALIKRVDTIEDRPRKNWDLVIAVIITSIVSGAIGILIALLTSK